MAQTLSAHEIEQLQQTIEALETAFWDYASTVGIRDAGYMQFDSIDGDSVSFRGEITIRGCSDQLWGDMPLAFVYDRDAWIRKHEEELRQAEVERAERKRVADEQKAAAKAERERAQYERLRAKFEGANS